MWFWWRREKSGGVGEWQKTTIGHCTVINDSTYSPKEAWPFVNYLDTGNITENRISEIQHLIVGKNKIPSRARRKAQPDDIVYSTVRPNQKHFGLLKEVPENFLASTGFSVIRGKYNLAHTNFIYWFLAQDHIVEQLQTIAEHSTSAYPSIRPTDIEELNLCLPPLPEQRAIAQILGTLDDKIELNRRMNETLEAMARALFKSWFVDFDPVRAKMEGRDTGLPKHIADLFPDCLVDSELGEIPEGWEVNTIGEIVKRKSVKKKYSQKTALKSGNVPILDQGKSGIIGYHNNAPGVDASPSNPIIVFANHTCYMRLIMHEFSAIQNVLPFEGKNHDIYWLYCATIGKQEFIEYKGHWPDFSIKEIIIPGRILQSEFGKVVAVLFQQIHLNDSQSHILANIRDALLPKLLSGELWVRREKVNSP